MNTLLSTSTKKASVAVTFAGVEWKFVILFYGSNWKEKGEEIGKAQPY